MSADRPPSVAGPSHSIEVPPPHDAKPDDLRRAAAWFERCVADVNTLTARLDATVMDLTQGTGQWQGPTADAFRATAWEPIKRTLVSLARALDQAAWSLRRAATALEDVQSERRRAEALAVAAGVGVALTVLTFGISDAAAAEAAAGAAALMSRAAMAAAGAMRTVVVALEDVGEAIRTLSVTMQSWGTGLGYAASVTLPRLMLSPVGAGRLGAAGTAALGDVQPADLVQAFAMSYLEGQSATSTSDEAEERVPDATIRDASDTATSLADDPFGTLFGESPPTNGDALWRALTTPDGQLIGTNPKGNTPTVNEVHGDLARAEAVYDHLSAAGEDETPASFPVGGSLCRPPDGTYISFRPRSKTGPPTLQFNISGRGDFKLKFKG